MKSLATQQLKLVSWQRKHRCQGGTHNLHSQQLQYWCFVKVSQQLQYSCFVKLSFALTLTSRFQDYHGKLTAYFGYRNRRGRGYGRCGWFAIKQRHTKAAYHRVY